METWYHYTQSIAMPVTTYGTWTKLVQRQEEVVVDISLLEEVQATSTTSFQMSESE